MISWQSFLYKGITIPGNMIYTMNQAAPDSSTQMNRNEIRVVAQTMKVESTPHLLNQYNHSYNISIWSR